jgi:hypothetical protein
VGLATSQNSQKQKAGDDKTAADETNWNRAFEAASVLVI